MTEDRVERDLWWKIGVATVGSLFHALFRLRILGLEHIPAAGPALLAANHVSVLDPIAIALGPSKRGRTVRFLTAAEFFSRPVIGWGLRKIRQIPVRRGERDLAALEQVAAVIKRGALAGIFPEGQLGSGEDLQRGRRGAARIALAAGVPVIPTAVWGAQLRWPKSGLRFSAPIRPAVAVVFGRPIPAKGDPRSGDDVQGLTERIMAGIGQELERAQPMAGR